MFRIGRTSMPGASISTSRHVIPSCLTAAVGSLRTSRIIHRETAASDVQIFCPFTM
jgi:hypothetical protein